MKKVRDFLIISFLGILLINVALISATLVLTKYGSATIYPGERYTLNIPFFRSSNAPSICGKAQTMTEDPLENINVSAYYNGQLVSYNITDSKGEYCFSLPELGKNREYDIFVEYENETKEGILKLGSNDYTLDFMNNQIYSKSEINSITLTGSIENEDAIIESGRIEINLKYQQNNTWKEILPYQKFSVNIDSDETLEIPNPDLTLTWQIPLDAPVGRYKWYIKSSFNARERTKDVFFNLTE